MRRKKRTEPAVAIDEEQTIVLKQLVANLADVPITDEQRAMGLDPIPSNRLPEMGRFQIKPEMLRRAGLVEQADVLNSIYTIVGMGGNPTPEAIKTRLALEYSDHEKAELVVGHVMFWRTLPAFVDPLAAGFADWYRHQQMIVRLEDAVKLAKEPRPEQELNAELISIYRDLTSNSDVRLHETDAVSNLGAAARHAQEMWQRRQQGQDLGPQWPLEGMRAATPGGIQPGQMWVVSGKTKHGKTSFADHIAYHIARNQKGYKVAFYHLETDALAMGTRQWARKLMVQVGALLDGTINSGEEPWASRIERYKEELQAEIGEGRYSKLNYIHCPGLTLFDLEKSIYEQKALAEAVNLEGVVIIIDYYQIMDWRASTGAREETPGLNELAIKLKDLFERTDKDGPTRVYGIVFAQDSATEDGRKTPFGGTMIAQRCQGHWQLLGHEDAEADLKMSAPDERGSARVNGHGGYAQALDQLGHPMYWHRHGDIDSRRVIRLLRGNNVRSGAEVYFQIANGYFVMEEISERPQWWRDAKNR